MPVKVRRLKVLTDTVPAAKRALAGASPKRVILTSPYVTSGDEAVAEAVVAEGDPSHTVVLTTFDAMTFATGGSSLATLRKLLKLCDLRSLPGLHAKVVLTDGVQIVGSQNLTAGGTRNREIGLRLSEPAVAESLREELEGWIKKAKPITEARIRDMERRVAKLADLAARLQQAAQEADAEADAATGQVGHSSRREPGLDGAIRGSDLGFEAKAVAYWGRTNISPTVGRQGLDLTSWRSDDEKQASLKILSRYLLVGPDGQMGWTRLSKECLGWVDVSRNPNATLEIGDFKSPCCMGRQSGRTDP